MKLRDYQVDAVNSTQEGWKKQNALVGVAATGAGKTQIFCELIRRNVPGRAMILAHRTELVEQAANRLKSFGLESEIEQGASRAQVSLFNRCPVVIATPQTLYSQNDSRLKEFSPLDFSLLIIDEAHHYVSPAYQRVVTHFKQNPNIRILGTTATPDRTDNLALAKIFDGVAFDIEIVDLIDRGYLVPIDQRMVKIESLDLSQCGVSGKDLNGADLAAVMEFEKTLLGIADATLSIVGDRRTCLFAATVKTAERFAEIFNRYKSGMADCVFGHTPDDKRREVFKQFRSGETQILVNVGVVTEGVDVPEIAAVVVARPTLSRALYCQMLGRGTRPGPGVIDAFETSEERKLAIQNSSKPNCIVLDFAGNSGRHSLITASDILGGRMSEETKTLAKKRIEAKGGGNVLSELRLAEQELRDKEDAARRSGVKAQAQFHQHFIDPFDAFKKRAEKWKGYKQRGPLSEKQRSILVRLGHDPSNLSKEAGKAVLDKHFGISDGQRGVLIRAGYTPKELDGLQKWEAAKLIDGVKNNGWKRPKAQ